LIVTTTFLLSHWKMLKMKIYLVKTTPEYQRYLITHDGITPRGIPGYGDGWWL
jgi:hypothetical protein